MKTKQQDFHPDHKSLNGVKGYQNIQGSRKVFKIVKVHEVLKTTSDHPKPISFKKDLNEEQNKIRNMINDIISFEILKNDFLDFGRKMFHNYTYNSNPEHHILSQDSEIVYQQFPIQDNILPLTSKFVYNNFLNPFETAQINCSNPIYFGCNIFFPISNIEICIQEKKIGLYSFEERKKRIIKYKEKIKKRREKIPLIKGYGSRKGTSSNMQLFEGKNSNNISSNLNN